MRRTLNFTPRLADGPGRLHERLASGIADAIECGELEAGMSLPAHRTIAVDLGMSVGTVTRAYDLLQRRGLARSERGRGMFVEAPPSARDAWIDLSVNLPPAILTTSMLAGLMSRAAETIEADTFNKYAPPAGLPEHRATLVRVITEGRDLRVDPARMIITTGAQHGIFIALAAAPPGPIAIEAFSYPGALRAARTIGRSLIPVAMDEQGIIPNALSKVLSGPTAPHTLYLMPSLQNPTGGTMDDARRREIVAIARKHDVIIIEDDIYSIFAPKVLPPLVQLAPERVLHVGSLSKSLAPGLRVGYLVAPPSLVEACASWIQATQSMANPLSMLLMTQALHENLAQTVAQKVAAEARRRTDIARSYLGAWIAPREYDGLHVWLPMATSKARDIVLAGAQRNIQLAPPEPFMADVTTQMSGLRLCLGTVSERHLRQALATLSNLLSTEAGVAMSLQPVA